MLPEPWPEHTVPLTPEQQAQLLAQLPENLVKLEEQVSGAKFYQFARGEPLSEAFDAAFLPFQLGQQSFAQCAQAFEDEWHYYASE